MKKIFNFTKKKKFPSNTSDNGSTVSGGGYDLKEKDLGKVHKAALLGDVAKLVQLAKKNDINQLDKENRTPLHIACASGHVDVVQFLVESKVKLNLCDNQNRSALMKAVQCQHERCVSVLLEGHADPNLVDINGNTALHLAANIPSSSIATLLLEHEADINAQNKEGFTPLAVTIRENHVEMAEFLLKEGTDLDISDQGQRSPLMIAAGNGQISMLRLLLQHDADISLKDSKGWSADDHAVINGHHACSHLIIEHGTKRNGVPSPSHQVPSRKKKKGLLGSPPHGAEAGFSLGGPAIDKDEHGAHAAGKDAEDNSQSESVSRPSVSAADDWPSSDGDDDELDLIPKKQPKLNLKKLIASKKGGNAAQLDRSLSGGESEPESDPRHQRSSSLPKTPRVPQHPVAPFPASFSKTPLKTSTPVQNSSKGGGELGGVGELMSEKASGSKPRSLDSPEGGPDGSPEAGDSEGENEDEEDVDDEEGDDDDDDDEEDDDDNEEEEEEEDEEDEESKEDEEGDDVESEEEEEEEDNSAASALDESNGIEDEHSGAGDLALMVNYSQKECSDNKVTESGLESVEPPDNDKPNLDVESDKEACSTAIPNNGVLGTLDVPGDCVVSAIRVESKFSDEDESMRSAGQNVGPREGVTGCIAAGHSSATPLLAHDKNVELGQDGNGDVEDWSLTDKAHSGDTSWNDSDDDNGDAGNQVAEHGRNTVLSKRSNVSPENAGQEKLDDPPDAKEEQCRSSWGSLLQGEDSDREGVKVDGDPPDQNRPGVEPEVVPQLKSTSPIPNEESLWDSSSPPLSPSKCNSPKFQLDLPTCSLASPLPISPNSQQRPKSRLDKSKSEWDSSSDDDEDCNGAKKKGLASTKEEASQIIDSVAIATLLVGANLASQTEEATHDVSPVVSPESQDEERPNSPLLDGNVELINPKAKERLGNQNYHDDDDNSWDDDENDEDNEVEGPVSPTQSGSKSFPQMKDKEVAVNSPVLKSGQDKDDGHNEDERSRSATPRNPSPMATPERVIHENEKNEEGEYGGDEPPVSMIEGNDSDKDFSPDPEDPGMGTIKGSPKPEEKSQNSDSRASKLRYDFASAMVKVLESGDDSDSTLGECPDEGPGERSDEAHEPRLTSYAPLGGADDVTHENITELEDHDNEEGEGKVDLCENASTRVHNAAESDSNGFSDEELPMTDIDDVDLDSPHELGNRNGESPRFGYTEDLVKQNEELTDDGEDGEEETDDDDDDDEEEEEEEEEEGLTSENDQAEEDQEEEEEASPAVATPSQDPGVSKDNRRDFLSELGLEKEEEEDDSWDSESHSESPRNSHAGKSGPCRKGRVTMPASEKNNGEVVSAANDVSDGKALHDEVAPQNEIERAKWEPLSVLNKLQAKTNRKTDLMEELGLGDVDDLEDASDWDSTSTASRRTLPGRRVPSPGPHAPFTPAQPQSPATNPLVPQKFAVSASRTSPPSPLARNPPSLVQPQTQPEPQAQPEPKTQPQPQPQPRARKMLPQKLDSDEESDWDSDNVTSPSPVKSDSQQRPNLPETQAAVRTAGLSVDEPPSDTEESPEPETQHKQGSESTSEIVPDMSDPKQEREATEEPPPQEIPDPHQEQRGSTGEHPWENRYENLWVEVEKREVKSTFRDVAAELKQKFGELARPSSSPDLAIPGQEPSRPEFPAVDEMSSDEEEEEGEPIMRPMAMARSAALRTIPEQRESGPEDSLSEPSTQACEAPDSDQDHDHGGGGGDDDITARDPGLLSEGPGISQRSRSPSPPPSVGSHTTDDGDSKDTLLSPVVTGPDPGSEIKPPSSEDDRWRAVDQERWSHAASASDLNEFAHTQTCLPTAHPAASAGVVEEHQEVDSQSLDADVHGLDADVQMPIGAFGGSTMRDELRLEEEFSKDLRAAMPAQRSSASWDAGGAAEEEERGAEKPEPESGSQAGANGSSPGEGGPLAPHESPVQRPAVKSPRSVNREPVLLRVPVQQNPHRDRDAMSLQGPSQLSMGGPRACSTPWTVAHLNGDPLSVFDDSTLSDLSDSEGRSPSACRRLDENMMGGEMELAEDLDELTQSSDTPTDDIESPASGYRHASMLIQKLDSTVLDSSSMVKLQNIFHEYENSIQKARGRHGHLSHKVSQLEGERRELSGTLEDLREAKSALERQQLELQTEVDNLRFKLKQEQENRRNASMLYDTGRDKLRRAEEHQQTEVEERQKVELALRSLELERRTLLNNMKQLEEDLSETQRLLAQERTARALQENLLSSHLRKQQEIEEESRRSVSRSNEALSQLTEASDREKALVQQTASMHEELAALRTELEHGRSAAAQEESRRAEEREALEERLEDARRDLRLNEEALTQTVFQYNGQLGALKTELSAGAARLEHERQAREVLEAELESARTRLAGALQEAERCQAARADTEKNLLRERDEHQRLRDKTTSEAAGQRDAVGGLSQRLAKAETRANGLENEVHRAALQLTEKSLLLEAGQRERDAVATRCRELEEALRAEKELATRSSARLEATQERLAQVQSDAALLRQQLEEAQNKGVAKERAVTDAQERFGDLVSQLRADGEGRVQMAEDRSRELAGKAGDLRDQVYKLEEEKTERESTVRQLQQELADSLKKLSMSEASLEVNTRYRNDLEEEKARLSKDQDRLRGKLDESEDQYVQAERRLSALKATLDDRERQLATADQKLREALSTSAGSDTTVKQLEEAVQRLEIENARLEAAAKQQANKIEALQKGAHEATVVRGRLEDLVTDLQGSKMTLEDQLNREVQRQSLLSHTAQDSQALWEEELKSRSKLGVRLAELEKERGDLGTQMETEKKKAKKMAEQKKAVDSRLDQEMKRNTDLQKEMYRLRTLLKTAKKKLREQDGGSPMGSQRMDSLRHSMRDKAEDMQGQLEREASRCRQLETANADLTERLASTQGLSRANQRLEEQLAELRRRRAQEEDAGLADPGQAERYRRNAEERASLQIRQKLEEVNLFLQNQAASQEALDQIKSANEANLRSQLEQRIRELEGEVGRARSGQQDSLNLRESTRSELERYRELYTDELRLRKSLAAKLDRANDRLAEANAKLMSERHRSKSLIAASSLANGSLGGSALDLGALGSLPAYGASLGPLSRSLGLGLGGSPLGDRQGGRVEEYLAKMQSELERNISKELNHATVELAGGGSARLSPVGSASAADLRDQASRAQQQYLAVLKKNNMI